MTTPAGPATAADLAPGGYDRVPRYAWYVLGVLFLVYVVNFIDRQIISILAEDIKRDLGISDQDLGFLYGTAFGVFYAIFGIPLGRLADSWSRIRLMTIGLGLWSSMTMMSGLASSGAQLTAARIGVGVGEAAASPCAYSLISDYFPARLRATALAIYSAGLYVGIGCSLVVGGLIVEHWTAAFPNDPPLGLAGWQAAFMAVGIPGLVIALVVARLREPVRGQSEGLMQQAGREQGFGPFFADLLAIVPPLTFIAAAMRGWGSLFVNVAVASFIAAIVAGAVQLGEPLPQWAAMGLGWYALFSWASALRRRDAPAFGLIFGTPAFLLTAIGYALVSMLSYSVGFWAAPYAIRTFGLSPAIAGLYVGGANALAGFLGVMIGGIVADRLHQTVRGGRVLVIVAGAVLPPPFIFLAFTTSAPEIFYLSVFLASMLANASVSAGAATTQDLVLPRMRGTATAIFLLGSTLLGLSVGPYASGRISTLTGDLAAGLLWLLAASPVTAAIAVIAWRLVPAAAASRDARAARAGEPPASTATAS